MYSNQRSILAAADGDQSRGRTRMSSPSPAVTLHVAPSRVVAQLVVRSVAPRGTSPPHLSQASLLSPSPPCGAMRPMRLRSCGACSLTVPSDDTFPLAVPMRGAITLAARAIAASPTRSPPSSRSREDEFDRTRRLATEPARPGMFRQSEGAESAAAAAMIATKGPRRRADPSSLCRRAQGRTRERRPRPKEVTGR